MQYALYKSLPKAVVHGLAGLLLFMLYHKPFSVIHIYGKVLSKYLLIELVNLGTDFLILLFLRYFCTKLFLAFCS